METLDNQNEARKLRNDKMLISGTWFAGISAAHQNRTKASTLISSYNELAYFFD